jgi:hypothetical protein
MTAFELSDLILRQNGYCFDRSDIDEIIRVMVKIAQYTCPYGEEIDKIARWIKRMVVRLD